VTTSKTISIEQYKEPRIDYLSLSIYYNDLSYEYSTESLEIAIVALLSGIEGTLSK